MMTVVDLKAAASAEVKRIAAARALVHDGDERTRAELEAGGPWVALARSTPLRRALRGRSLQLWRVALKDANGRLVDSTLIPIAFDASDTPTATDVAARVEQAAASWRDEATHTLARFAAVRLARERAIAAARERSVGAVQPGLFDRRADRRYSERFSAQASSADEEQARLDAIERGTTVIAQPARLLLVMTPARAPRR